MRIILLISISAISLIILLLFLLFYPAGVIISPTEDNNSSGYLCIKGNCFQVQLAETELQREKGLMHVKELDKDKGMLFIFDKEGIYPFWMKNTLIPLDMIWIDSNYKIVFISQNVQPCRSLICPSIIPNAKANYVLEINAGILQNLGIKIGDMAEFKIN